VTYGKAAEEFEAELAVVNGEDVLAAGVADAASTIFVTVMKEVATAVSVSVSVAMAWDAGALTVVVT